MADTHFKYTELESIIAEHALLIVGYDGLRVYPGGTGVFIAPNLLMTAKHVIEECWNSFGDGHPFSGSKKLHGQFHILAVQYPGDRSEPAVWSVRTGWAAPSTDIMFLDLVPFCEQARAYEWKGTVVLNVLPPSVGDAITGFGYPSSSAEILHGEPSQIRFVLQPHTTVGIVTQVFEERRDRALLTFPCFELNARFEGGMSGGPLFNSAGQVCGIICASLQQADQQASYVSYGATLWPAMGTNIEFQGPGLICKGPYPVAELSLIGVMHVIGWEEVVKRVVKELDYEGREWLRLRPLVS